MYTNSPTLRNYTGQRVNGLHVQTANPVISSIVVPPFDRYYIEGNEIYLYDPWVPVLPNAGARMFYQSDVTRPANIVSYSWAKDGEPVPGSIWYGMHYRTTVLPSGSLAVEIHNPNASQVAYQSLKGALNGSEIPFLVGASGIVPGESSIRIAELTVTTLRKLTVSFEDERCGLINYYASKTQSQPAAVPRD